MPDAAYEPVEERMAFVDALEERLESIPGASRVTLASVFPGIGHPRASVAVSGVHDPGAPDLPRSGFARVSPGYFETFLAPLLSGRAFDRGDRAGELPVAIVNAAFERMHLAGDAVGRRVSFPAIDGVEEWHTVVGVVPDFLAPGIDPEHPLEVVYVPLAQGWAASCRQSARRGWTPTRCCRRSSTLPLDESPARGSRPSMRYHLIGIAGTAMASLAGLLRAKGHEVTGSDEGVYPPMSDMLHELGIEYAQTFSPLNLAPAPDMVVVGNAISRGNAELEAVLDMGLRYTSAADVIKNELLWDRHVLAVAGTHGKTTTTSILAWLLESAGLRPSFLVGGVAENFGTSFRLTDSEHFVIEADEYDTAYFDKGPKMWHYLPRTAVVGNVEFDHADIYRDETAYRFAFERFVNLVPRIGTLVLGWQGGIERELAGRSLAPVESFALEADGDGSHVAGAGDHPRWRAVDVSYGAEGTSFTVLHDGRDLGMFRTALSGAFNVRNCLAAMAAARAAGASWEGIRQGLATFRSVRRRMEVRGEVRGVTVIDDFAHHPTAVRETIAATRQRFGRSRVVAIFEPRSYTAQRREFQERFRAALATADRVVLAGLFHPERYDEGSGMDPRELVAGIRADGVEADYVPDVGEIVRRVIADAGAGDVLLVMSNGGFGGIHHKLLEALEAR